ncbi:MAG TPA: transketolase [Vicinamibacterales bacterium]|nr:transketolase [Vicinamibacterales bacterium]
MPPHVSSLKNIATRLRIESIRATTAAASGHPTTCMSAADLMAALFFADMRFDPKNPQHPEADRLVMSKGHAAPLLYALWAEAGAIPRERLTDLRLFTSNLEGHPTPRLPFVDVATGSLGQGLAAGVGCALNARRIGSDYRTYVLMGDGETAEGSVWEAAASAHFFKLDSLCAILDINALGQSRPTELQHDLETYRARWSAFGWHVISIDGHDLEQILDAYQKARTIKGRPTAILARTLKGKGVSVTENLPNWHGKPLSKEQMEKAIEELNRQMVPENGPATIPPPPPPRPEAAPKTLPPPQFKLGDMIATREAYGSAIAKLGAADPRVVALDADVKNSTFSEKFEAVHPDRFYQFFIAEQVMVGAAMGLAARGAIPFPSTFAAFFTRAADFIRMAAISGVNIKLAGSHAGVSIGEDGPSQMALEDFAMATAQPNFVALYPSDAVSTERLVAEAAAVVGPVYIRTSRPKTPVIYDNNEEFPIGGLKVVRKSDKDVATVIGAGVTLFEALKAHDELKGKGVSIRVIDLYSVQPIDAASLIEAGRATSGRLITVEDHYISGGLGDAVARAVAPAGLTVRRLAIPEIPRSGKPDELLDKFGISSRHIVNAVMG